MSSTTVFPEQVVIGPADDEQRGTLAAAMSQALTTAPGLAGTAKNALIVNLVATAVAAAQRVLVVSSDEAAVDEVWQRCEQAVSGLIARPGSLEPEVVGGRGVAEDEGQPLSSARAAYNEAARAADSLRQAAREKAATEAEVLAAKRQRTQALEAIGTHQGTNDGAIGSTSGAYTPAFYRLSAATDKDLTRLRARSHKLSQPRRWSDGPRRRFLERLGIAAAPASAVTLCLAVWAFAEAEISWRALHPRSGGKDDGLAASLAAAEEQERLRGAELVKAKLHSLRVGKDTAAPALAVTCSTTKQIARSTRTFDLVIIDDANHCSAPTAVPALFLAKRAVVIGDV